MKINLAALSKILFIFLLAGNTTAQNADDILQGPSGSFGNGFDMEVVSNVEVSFSLGNSTLPTIATFDGKQVLRDVRIRFAAISGDSSGTSNGTSVTVNGVELFTTESFFGAGPRNFDFVINRNDLNSGTNTIVFTPINSGGGSVWGIREINSAYVEAIELTSSTDTNEYGFEQIPPRFTGLRANFTIDSVANDFILDVTGKDIDLANETRVFLNGRSLGFLSTSPNNMFNQGDTFTLAKTNLSVGLNQIEFVQRTPGAGWNGFESEKWSVTNLAISELTPDLTPSSVTIQESPIAPNVAFTVITQIDNIGEGLARPSVIRYYASTDEIITTRDSFIDARSFPSINAGSSRTITKSISTPLVDRDVYFGVCIAPITNETSETNNCSTGILLNNAVPEPSNVEFVSAVMLLLLGE